MRIIIETPNPKVVMFIADKYQRVREAIYARMQKRRERKKTKNLSHVVS